MVERQIDGTSRLFSTVGFSMLDEDLRGRILAAYTSDGKLDQGKIQRLLPESDVVDYDDYVRIVLKDGPLKEILLADFHLISLDPKLDSIISKLTQVLDERRQRPPRLIAPIL